MEAHRDRGDIGPERENNAYGGQIRFPYTDDECRCEQESGDLRLGVHGGNCHDYST